MFFVYSTLLTLAFVALLPMFIVRREKYASGFAQRMGNLPDFDAKGAKVVWLHCVSVGEVNAARTLVDRMAEEFPEHRIVVSTTTRTGQELARSVFQGKAACVFYFPFDWAFTVRRALRHFSPDVVLLMETEIWPNFIREAKRSGAKVVILNGRLSQKSFESYSRIGFFIRRVLAFVDLALMQAPRDAERMTLLGVPAQRAVMSGNLKFDQKPLGSMTLTEQLRSRFALDGVRPLIVAASTHDPEEKLLLEVYRELSRESDARLMLVPRHPERFDQVARLAASSGFQVARRSEAPSPEDTAADIVILDSIGELRSVYPLSDLVFCGGSLIPHGGQSMLEPAAEGKAVVTGPYTHNFSNAVEVFSFHDGLVQLKSSDESGMKSELLGIFRDLLKDSERRLAIGRNARDVMERNRGAAERTLSELRGFLSSR